MTEEENVSVEDQHLHEESSPPSESEYEQSEPQAEVQPQQKKRNDAEHNWSEARRKMQELDRVIREQQEVINQLKGPKVDEDDLGIDDDALVEGKTVKNLKRELRELKSYLKTQELSTVEDRLSMKFPDFNDVVNAESIEILKQQDPEIAEVLHEMRRDPYKQGAAAYKYIKKLLKDAPSTRDVAQKTIEKRKLQENISKPMSVQAAPKQSALGNAHMFENGLSKELKAQLWAEMQQLRKQY